EGRRGPLLLAAAPGLRPTDASIPCATIREPRSQAMTPRPLSLRNHCTKPDRRGDIHGDRARANTAVCAAAGPNPRADNDCTENDSRLPSLSAHNRNDLTPRHPVTPCGRAA